jgi:hypothetical protein
MWCVVACGLLASVRNPTAAVLVVAWAIPQASWMQGGSNMPVDLYRLTDLCAAAVILMKLRFAGTRWDWLVLAIFAAMWGIYDFPMDDRAKWFTLWSLAILQFAAATAEAVEGYHTLKRNARVWRQPPPGWFSIPGRYAWDLSN